MSYYITMLLDHRRICGPSLTETSLCGAYLYLFPDITTHSITNTEVATKWPPAGTRSSGQHLTSLRHCICGVTSPRQFPLTQTGTHPLSEDKGYNSMRLFGFNQPTHTCD